MSTAIDIPDDNEAFGFPELTPLGKQIEVLRIGRGMSKQHLARYAGTSRQQLWRVMTGKTELTSALKMRLADVLRVAPAALDSQADPTSTTIADSVQTSLELQTIAPANAATVSAEAYLLRVECVEATLRTLPNGDDGRELKRNLLNRLEDLALERNVALPAAFFDLRRRVLAGEL
jgi:transcriptional regulator with XRE-family HTH domain